MVESITQLTDDGELKQGRLVSDGSRIYFTEGQSGSWKIAQVSVSGGRTAMADTRLDDPRLAALAPNGSELLVLPGEGWTGALWSIPLPAGEPLRLGSVDVSDASYFPDGRILFAKGQDLYVADKDGSNLRKLVSVADEVLYPSVSQDGKRIVFTIFSYSSPKLDGRRVAFSTSRREIYVISREIYVISMDGGPPQRIVERNSAAANWSPDGNLLVFNSWIEGMHPGEPPLWGGKVLDIRTGKTSVVSFSYDKSGAMWVSQDTLVASAGGSTKFMRFDFKSQKWTELAAVHS